MRTSILTLAAGLAHLVAGAINITTTNDVDLEAGTGDLGWGASGLPFGYSAGSGLDFDEDAQNASGGFNGAVPGQEGTTAIGGGFTVNATGVVLGLGGVLGETTFGVEVFQDRETGVVSVKVNGKAVEL